MNSEKNPPTTRFNCKQQPIGFRWVTSLMKQLYSTPLYVQHNLNRVTLEETKTTETSWIFVCCYSSMFRFQFLRHSLCVSFAMRKNFFRYNFDFLEIMNSTKKILCGCVWMRVWEIVFNPSITIHWEKKITDKTLKLSTVDLFM